MNMRFSKSLGVLTAAAVLALGCGTAHATDVKGAGSSFVYPVMSKWAASYAEKTGNHVNYQSIGSGGGIAQIKAGTVDFGASDQPLDRATLKKHGLGQFPDVIGGIVPVYNIPDVGAGELVLDGPTLANIFLGKITRWNGTAIKALNPDVKLPNQKIIVVHRSDGSGTTFNFTNYLNKVSSAWKSKVGQGKSVKWPVGIGGKGNEGVSAYVKQMPYSVGYVEYAYALEHKLGFSRMKNAAGKIVKPDAGSFQAAAATADWAHARNFNLLLTNAPGAKAWPITATSWVIMYKKPKDPATTKVAFDFFRYGYTEGRAAAEALEYVPLPESLVKKIENYWDTQFQLGQ
ncbi:MAG: phosphate ABC transporter substrate-binding protein PstS [Sinobacteraceae bacterium]|nr:phosphate ABC transporter substrate-binding protein PstS [Nevskiaceae bacterium]